MSPDSPPTADSPARRRILDPERIRRKIKRIAYEILEDNYDEDDIVLAGICRDDEGYALAGRLATEMKRFGEAKIHLTAIDLDKADPAASSDHPGTGLQVVRDRVVIVVDDVANTGRTQLYAIKPLLAHAPRRIRIAVLVDRKHKAYPICADYVGTSLSTTLYQHIDVELRGGKDGVFLR